MQIHFVLRQIATLNKQQVAFSHFKKSAVSVLLLHAKTNEH